MLSEFHLMAHSVRFIGELQDCDEVTPETVETCASPSSQGEDGFATLGPSHSGGSGNAAAEEDTSFPSYLLLYVLWRPDMTTSVTNFTNDVILKAVEKMQAHHVDIASSDEDKRRSRDSNLSKSPSRMSLNSNNETAATAAAAATTTTTTTTDQSQSQSQSQEFNTNSSRDFDRDSVTGSSLASENGKTRLYLVVERTIPFQSRQDNNENKTDDDNNDINAENNDSFNPDTEKDQQRRQFEVEVALAERLARHIASHPQLRSVFEGITVGIANHKRAAPALDACLNVINIGARDRRTISRDAKSHVGIISWSSDDLLGLDEEGETDAAQDILQTRISTEWNGKGNLESFGYRAHAMWRKDYGLLPQPSDIPLSENKRRVPRRLRRLEEDFESFPLDLLLNLGAFILIAYYVWKGLVDDDGSGVVEDS